MKLLLVILLISVSARAQLSSELNTHLIIAFDNSLDNDTKRKALKEKNGLVAKMVERVSNELLKQGDYYTIVNFVITPDVPDFTGFVKPSTDNKAQNIVWRPFTSSELVVNGNGDWEDIAYTQGRARVQFKSGTYSLLSGARQYSLMASRRMEDDKVSNKVFMLLVTDNWFANMDDYRKDFESTNFERRTKLEVIFNSAMETVNNSYRFEHVKDYPAGLYGYNERYKGYLYEVIPNNLYALGTVVDYPANMGLKRVRGGYRLKFDYHCMADDYVIKKISVSVSCKNGDIISKDFPGGETVDMSIKSSQVGKDSIYITIRGWMLINDTIYSGIVANPYDARFGRLNVNRATALPDEYKIFGSLTLWDVFWWWYPENQQRAVIVWEVILVPLIIIIVLVIGYMITRRVTRYRPEDENITLEHQ